MVVEHSVALGRLWSEGALDIMIGPTSVVVVDAIVTWNVELQWMCALDYASDRRLPLDLVAFAAPCLWRQRMIDALVAANREHRIAFTSQSVMALRATVENGLGIGLLPPESPRTSATRTLKPAASVPGPLVVQYGLYTHDQRAPVVDAALEVLRESIPASSTA